MEELIAKFTPSLRKYALPIIIGIIGMILLVYGLMSSFSLKEKNDDIQFISNKKNTEAVKSAVSQTGIKVDVAGAVVNPGVYSLLKDARLEEAIVSAGGLSDEADHRFVENNFNLALKLRDGAKVYVPSIGEGIGSSATNTTTDFSQGSIQATEENRMININTASESELDTLIGVGQVTAKKIISNRPYEVIEELLRKQVIGNSVFEKIKEKISVY